MDYSTRQEPLEEGPRVSLNVTLAPSIIKELGSICAGNRSAAIEKLVREHVLRTSPEIDAA
jgi:hypothetical protein